MIETSDLVAAGEVAEFAGQAWTFSHITPSIRGAVSAWLKGRARQGLQEERNDGTLSASAYREEADALKRQFDAGEYNWGSPFHPEAMGAAVAAAIDGLDGKVYLTQLLLKASHGDVPAAKVVELMEADPKLFILTIGICLDPNRVGPLRQQREELLAKRNQKMTNGSEAPAAVSPTSTATLYSQPAASAGAMA